MKSTVCTLVALACAASAKVVEHNFTLGWHNASPDGVKKRMNLVNGQFPGPEVRATVGDTVRVHMKNNLGDNATTVREY